MVRRRSDSDDDVSLFPFLSIIACVIGVLTLMISTLALAQLDTSAVVQAEQLEKTRRQVAEAQQQLQTLQNQLTAEETQAEQQASAAQREATALRNQLKELTEQMQQEQSELEQMQQLEIVVPEVPKEARETVDDMKSQLAMLREQIAQLEKQLAERKLPPEEAEVSILPAGSGYEHQPFFVECADGAIVIHGQGEPLRIRAAEMATNEKFIELLETVASGKNNILLFLVRSDGLSTYRAAKKLADVNDIPNGKLPVVGNGRIDLEYFQQEK